MLEQRSCIYSIRKQFGQCHVYHRHLDHHYHRYVKCVDEHNTLAAGVNTELGTLN